MRKYSLKRIPHRAIKVGPKTYLTTGEVKGERLEFQKTVKNLKRRMHE